MMEVGVWPNYFGRSEVPYVWKRRISESSLKGSVFISKSGASYWPIAPIISVFAKIITYD